MKMKIRASLAVASTLTLTALLAACGGGGGGSTTPPTTGGGGGGGGSTPTPPASTPTPPGSTPTPPGSTPTPPPTATPTPSATGELVLNGAKLANATVVFTCGCNGDGGKVTTDANGNYTIKGGVQDVLGTGPYTPNGNNLMIVGYSPSTSTQTWTMTFLGATPAHNLTLSANSNVNVSDTATTAASVYVYYAASQVASPDKTFDWFNFNQIIQFANHMRSAPSTQEQQLMSDITAAQASGKSLFPSFAPTWNAVGGDGVNATITADVKALVNAGLAADSTLPTPCPGVNQCTNAPTP